MVVRTGIAYDAVAGAANGVRRAVSAALYFDLAPVLDRAQSRLRLDRERLKLVCERHIQALTPLNRIQFSGNGFFLYPSNEVDTEALAEQINISLLELFFGSESRQSGEGLRLLTKESRRQDAPRPPPSLYDSSNGSTRLHASDAAKIGEQQVNRCAMEYGDLEFAFVPVVDFQKGRATSFFCVPVRIREHLSLCGYQEVASSFRDTLDLDIKLFQQTSRFAQKFLQGGIYAGVGASVSYETLVRQKTRQAYQQLLRAAQASENPLLILEIEGLPRGIPAGRVADIVQSVRPFARRIFVRLPDLNAAGSYGGLLGAAGFVMSLRRNTAPDQANQIIRKLLSFCSSQGALSCIDRVDGDAQWNLVRASGARFGVRKSSADDVLDARKAQGQEGGHVHFLA